VEHPKTNQHNIYDAARAFGINHSVVYDILKKQAGGDFKDHSQVPKHQHNKTPPEIEQKVIEVKNKTRLGRHRLSLYLCKCEEVDVPAGTIRQLLRRNRHLLTYSSRRTPGRRKKREFVDRYNAKCFDVVQVDFKHVRDQKTLTKQEMINLDRWDIPN
jgi:hypothetical protein